MGSPEELRSAFDSDTFGRNCSFQIDKPVGSASISPCGRDVALASRQGLHIIDLDSPYAPPRDLAQRTPWEVADVQWSPFAARDYWVVSTSNQKAFVWNLCMIDKDASVEHVLHGHKRAITDINFSAHHPDILATCAVDTYVHCWDLRRPSKPAMTFCDWFGGVTQVKWNRQDSHILASSHDKYLKIWDDRKGAQPLNTIAAHSTKIYGVDWDRLESQKLTTCSLDQTIKLWNYKQEAGEPEKVIHTPFPVWRARHTPFGTGLVALPQRGDYDLHLYDYRHESEERINGTSKSLHQFSGHIRQVKEFLWRPRGTVTSTVDDREFQLVSWGADQHLRLHEVNAEIFSKVGYTKGMEVKRTLNFTRRGATYKTFRNEQTLREDDDFRDDLTRSSAITAGISRSSMPFSNGYGSGGFMSSVVNKKSTSQEELDPVSWMQGVKIGKRAASPSGMPDSVPSLLSPALKPTPSWDTFDSLGEEIATTLSKFPKVACEDIDVQRRRITVSLSGPWGAEKSPTQLKCGIDFPSAYPNSAALLITIENAFSMSEKTSYQISSEAKDLADGFASQQRHSLEAILRYLLGEQSLDESLQWLKKHSTNPDTATGHDLDLSSSSDEDDDLARYVPPPTNGLESSDLMIAVNNAEYNVPLPKACGASWSENGRLVCFFPRRLEKETSLLDQSIVDAHLQKTGKDLFEGFGRLHRTYRQKHTSSTLETLTSGDSDDEYELVSSDSSSASDGNGLPSHHFLPMVPWNGFFSGANPENTLDASQKSVGDTAQPSTAASKVNFLVTIHDLSQLLPVKELLARRYDISSGYNSAIHNAAVARDLGDLDLVDAWACAALLLRASGSDEIIIGTTQSGYPSLIPKDSAIDLSYDTDIEQPPSFDLPPVKWESQNLGRRWLAQSVLDHFEVLGNVQMLAMLTCALSPSPESPQMIKATKATSQGQHFTYHAQAPSQDTNFIIASEDNTRFHSRPGEIRSPLREDWQDYPSGPGSITSSTGIASSDPSSSLASSAMPPNSPSFLTPHEPRISHNAGLSTSPEHYRTFHGTTSNLSALTASFPRPFHFSNPVASSPPNSQNKKRPSPTGSFLGPTPSNNTWAPSNWMIRTTPIAGDSMTSIPDSTSDTEEEKTANIATTEPPNWTCKLKNQDQFHSSDQTDAPLLDPDQELKHYIWRQAYANLLQVWDMHLEAAEVLKYNHSDPAVANNATVATTKSFPTEPPDPHTEHPSLDLRPHCQGCSTLHPTSTAINKKCRTCHQSLQTPLCIYCNTYIHGLISPCLHCGHAIHLACRIAYSEHLSSLEDVNDSGGGECITGCGCICTDHTSVEMAVPAETLHSKGSTNDTAFDPASGWNSSNNLNADDDDGHAEESSLAGTTYASVSVSVNEPERAGWDQYRHQHQLENGNGKDNDVVDDSYDDAYVRLRRSLAGGIAMRRGSAGAVRGLRGSGSQIWRGG